MAKIPSVVRLATHKLIVSVDAVGVQLLVTTLAGKHIGAVWPNFVLAKHLQRLESFFFLIFFTIFFWLKSPLGVYCTDWWN